MNSNQLKSLLVNPKFWGAIIGLLTTLGISYFKDVDPNVLVGAIITITTIFVGGSAYENGKKEIAAAHVVAANTAAAAFRAAQPPAQTVSIKDYINTNPRDPQATPINSEKLASELQEQLKRMIYPQGTPAPSSPASTEGPYRNLAPYLSTPPKE